MNKKIYCTNKQLETLIILGMEWECATTSPKKRMVSLPTIEEAAKFMREDRGIDLVVSPRFNSKTGDRVGYFWRWSQRTDVIDPKIYKTFEGALKAGISKVLEPFKEYFTNETHRK